MHYVCASVLKIFRANYKGVEHTSRHTKHTQLMVRERAKALMMQLRMLGP